MQNQLMEPRRGSGKQPQPASTQPNVNANSVADLVGHSGDPLDWDLLQSFEHTNNMAHFVDTNGQLLTSQQHAEEQVLVPVGRLEQMERRLMELETDHARRQQSPIYDQEAEVEQPLEATGEGVPDLYLTAATSGVTLNGQTPTSSPLPTPQAHELVGPAAALEPFFTNVQVAANRQSVRSPLTPNRGQGRFNIYQHFDAIDSRLDNLDNELSNSFDKVNAALSALSSILHAHFPQSAENFKADLEDFWTA